MLSVLLRIARAVLMNVLVQIGKQVLTIQERVQNPTQSIIQKVTGGVWIGKGADAFVNELSTTCLPGVMQTVDNINDFKTKVTSAKERIEQADEEAERLIRSRLTDAFNFY
ncbi:hypothetical protein [Candidatus Oscillochloris fontis]|uniref:hypothetical protein n=1 Tax=Candidatus Oscillochloris fontis TaxID=2496868 RepID=UPI00101B9583|nr:hypothetical protein [Candidatus Oscillochloris fontis]